jgi:hypothetical protein
VRVRAARYRDGSTARSVTIRAHLRTGPVAVDLIHTGPDEAAQDLAVILRKSFDGLVSVRLIDAADPENKDIVALLVDEAPPGAALCCAIDGRAVRVGPQDLPAHLRDSMG